ncbi:MAG: uroporphyrinogen-III C-methyltransferase [Woeseia sp.]
MKRKQDDPQTAGDERETPSMAANPAESPIQETTTGSSGPIAAEASRETGTSSSEASGEALGEAAGDPATSPRTRSYAASIVAALALILALAAALGVAWLTWQGLSQGTEQAATNTTLTSLAGNLDEARQSLDDLQQEVADLDESDRDVDRELASLTEQVDGLNEDLESLPARVADLETTMASLQGISTGARENWWLAEAEYYMQIANAQLQLAGNPLLAAEALRFSDERVRQLGNPALTGVRRALSAELQALDAMVKPDVEGITMRLASLTDAISSLPIEENVAQDATGMPAIDPDAGPLDRTWASLKAAFGDVVSVRRSDEAVQPLLSPDARYFLRANLALQMQAARLALLRGEQSVFAQSLIDAEDWLREYYDRDSAAVQSALATIADIRDRYTTTDLPDISESLRLLRQYRARAGAGEAVNSAVDNTVENADGPDDNSQ